MPQLQRNTRKLLRQVKNQQYATQDDYSDPLPTPPPTNSTRASFAPSNEMDDEDIMRDPDSGSSDVEQREPVRCTGELEFKYPQQVDGPKDTLPTRPSFRPPPVLGRQSSGRKRSSGSDEASSDDGAIFGSQASQKRQKTIGLGNIHGPATRKGVYGKRRHQDSTNRDERKKSKEAQDKLSNTEHSASTRPVFKKAIAADVFQLGKNDVQAVFEERRQPKDTEERRLGMRASHTPSSSSLSSARSSPEVVEIQSLNLPEPKRYVSTTECAICHEEVELFLKQDFEDQFMKGQIMSYRWQQRFCRYHQQNKAWQTWKERGYPDIQWDALEQRMRKHHTHLRDVMSQRKPSHYRNVLNGRIKAGSRTTMQVVNEGDAKRGVSVGYYGPRGEKIMTDHIVTHLSSSLREQAAKDKVVAAAGVSGGVSGFVQAVLVPELAQQLVTEDMGVSGTKARAIIVESEELGELLHLDVDDEIVTGDVGVGD